jgi:hypothetical protein
MISAVERGFRPLDDDDEPPLDLRPSAFFKWLAAADVRDLSPPLVRTDTLLALSAILPDAATSISYADSRRSSSERSTRRAGNGVPRMLISSGTAEEARRFPIPSAADGTIFSAPSLKPFAAVITAPRSDLLMWSALAVHRRPPEELEDGQNRI